MSVTGSTSSTNLNCLKGKISSLAPYAVDNTLSVEGSAADAMAVGVALDKKVGFTDIVDDLETSDSERVLSANQGVQIKQNIENLRLSTNELLNNMEQDIDALENSIMGANNNASSAQTAAKAAQTTADGKISPDGSVAMEEDFNMGENKITNLAEPVKDTDAVNKKYADEISNAKTVSVTLKSSDWYSTTDKAPYSQDITVEGLVDGVKAKVWAVYEGDSSVDKPVTTACGYVNTAMRSGGKIVFTCFDKRPTKNIPIMVELYHGDTEDGECIPMIGFGEDNVSMDLLWVNATPSIDFAATETAITIPGASDYDYFMIVFVGSEPAAIAKKGSAVYPMKMTSTTSSDKLYLNFYYRSLTVDGDGLKAGDCHHLQYAATTFKPDATTGGHCKPWRIYGIKGVAV